MFKNKLLIACLMAFHTAVAVASTVTPAPTATVAPAATVTPTPVAATDTAAAVAPSVAVAPSAAAPDPVVTIRNCTYSNGLLGDANAPIRDLCLSQTTDISTGKAHRAIDFAVGYYTAMKCTPANSILDGNCKNAANTIANGVALAFHLDYTTLHKIRRAVPAGSANGCPCSGVS